MNSLCRELPANSDFVIEVGADGESSWGEVFQTWEALKLGSPERVVLFDVTMSIEGYLAEDSSRRACLR